MKNFLFWQNLKNDKGLLFKNPIKLLILCKHDNIDNFFAEILSYVKQGYYIAGFCKYEMGYLFEDKFKGYSRKVKIDIDELDLYFWSLENGEIFK